MSSGADLIANFLAADGPGTVTVAPVSRVLEFRMDRAVLLPLLDKAITVVPTRDVMPVLKCFQMHVDPQRLRIIASDAVRTLLVSSTQIETHWPGVAVFPAKKLLEIVKAAAGDTVHITVSGTSATVAIGPSLWTLSLPSGADYPPIPAIADAAFTTVDRLVFQNAIAAVRYAASRDAAQANMDVIDIADGRLTATNGTRVQQVQVSELTIRMHIPVTVVDDLLRLLRLSDRDSLYVGQSDHQLIFRFGTDVFIVSKYHANFPDVEASLLRPALENKHSLICGKAGLLAAIRRVRINADADSSGIALSLDEGTLTVSTQDRYGNTAGESIDVIWSGGPRTLVVHHGFLTDMINTYGEDTCCFRIGDDTKTRRSPLMLRDETTGSIAVTQQMQADWVNR